MAINTVRVTLLIRSDETANWIARNPILAEGEYGLEHDENFNVFLIKIGDGVRDWAHLPYLNKLNDRYFKHMTDGTLTFSDWFAALIENLITLAGGEGAHIIINDDPEEPTDPINYDYLQRFVTAAIQNAGHLKRVVVNTLPIIDINENTIYMVPSSSGLGYDEYMYIQGVWDLIGATGEYTEYVLPVATVNQLGGVRADDPTIPGHENTEYLSVTQLGFMTLNKVSTTKLYVPTGDSLIIYGGSA